MWKVKGNTKDAVEAQVKVLLSNFAAESEGGNVYILTMAVLDEPTERTELKDGDER